MTDLDYSCPECKAGKHGNCDGSAVAPVTDEITTCPCAARAHAPAPAGFEPAVEDLDLPPDHVASGEVPALAGISYRQFDYWVRRGLIRVPDRGEGAGSGVPRTVSLHEVDVARLMGELVAAGVNPAAASGTAREILATGTGRLGRFTVRRVPVMTPAPQPAPTREDYLP